jgi:hypothetical protein
VTDSSPQLKFGIVEPRGYAAINIRLPVAVDDLREFRLGVELACTLSVRAESPVCAIA